MDDVVKNLLNELTISKLKSIAAEHHIDVSSCRHKSDYVQRIATKRLTEDEIRASLDKLARGRSEAEIGAIKDDIETIARSPGIHGEMPRQEMAEISKHVDETIAGRPAFYNMDAMTEAARSRMIVGDYAEVIRINREERMSCLELFSAFQVYSAAVSIKAAEMLFSKMQSENADINPVARMALAEAKKAFVDGPPRRREEAIDNLEAIAAKSFSAFLKNTEKEEQDLRGLLSDYESFGVRTEEAKRYLDIAAQAKQSNNLSEYARLVRDARKNAENAKNSRKGELGSTYHIVRSAVAEAGDAGVDIKIAESDLKRAKETLDDGKFKEALDLMVSIERTVDSAHQERIRSRLDLEATQRNKVTTTLSKSEPVLMEAASFGLNVGEGLGSVGAAKTALARKDIVSAAKFARRAGEIASATEKPLDQKRIERGIMTPIEDAKCGKCGKEALYAFPNESRKCIECGHSFSLQPVTQQAPVQNTPTGAPQTDSPKKKGLFRW